MGGGRTHLLSALSHLSIDHASLPRRSAAPMLAPNTETSNFWVLVTCSRLVGGGGLGAVGEEA